MLHLFASIIAAKLYKNHNRALELTMNMRDNWLYVYNKYGFIMHKLHAYRLGIISMALLKCIIPDCEIQVKEDIKRMSEHIQSVTNTCTKREKI